MLSQTLTFATQNGVKQSTLDLRGNATRNPVRATPCHYSLSLSSHLHVAHAAAAGPAPLPMPDERRLPSLLRNAQWDGRRRSEKVLRGSSVKREHFASEGIEELHRLSAR